MKTLATPLHYKHLPERFAALRTFFLKIYCFYYGLNVIGLLKIANLCLK